MDSPNILEGGCSVDDRGRITYIGGAHFAKVKRFYVIENFSTDVIRAFHGHRYEEKFVFVVSGAAILVIAEILDYGLTMHERYVLSADKPQLLYIPAGFANGFRTLTQDTKIMFFSTATVDESKADDERYDSDYFGQEIWEVKNR
jgi:dTDP-4-dehydrorhamnose 3,5-epimerase-like enzyme